MEPVVITPEALAEEFAREQNELDDDWRDECALRLMTGMLVAKTTGDTASNLCASLATHAFNIADAMMAERRKRRG